ncbi:hypothetical protein [Rubrivirga marina]|uniref:Uncharacterized protein n=1 Tax=Rubrivirga marina TaxID=1196024 RepID=A0A271IYP2_9BACT|nr:hypothetical protein [Rubrivirga marina]PAP76376.1 hypothetical protein BSZ37_07930 [Rubrivirga marina]
MGYPLYLIDGGTVFTQLKKRVARAKASTPAGKKRAAAVGLAQKTVLGPISNAVQAAVPTAASRRVAALPRDVSRFANLHVDQWISHVGPHASQYAREIDRPPGSIVLPGGALPQVVEDHKADVKAPNRGMLGVIGEALLVAALDVLGHGRDDFVQLKISNKKRFPDFAIVNPSGTLQSLFPASSLPVDYLPVEVKASGNGRKVRKNGKPSKQPSVLGPLKEAAMQTLSFWKTVDALAKTNRGPGPSVIFLASRDLYRRTFNLFLITGR